MAAHLAADVDKKTFVPELSPFFLSPSFSSSVITIVSGVPLYVHCTKPSFSEASFPGYSPHEARLLLARKSWTMAWEIHELPYIPGVIKPHFYMMIKDIAIHFLPFPMYSYSHPPLYCRSRRHLWW